MVGHLMEREPYWDYMGRRLREDRSNMTAIETDMAQLTESYYGTLIRLKSLAEHNEMLMKKLEKLGYDPRQLEMDI